MNSWVGIGRDWMGFKRVGINFDPNDRIRIDINEN